MKIYIPTNPLWYFAVLVLIAPFFAVNIIHPAWMVRLVAVSGLQVGVVMIGLYGALTLHKTIKEDAPLVKKYGKKRMVWIGRIIFVAFALFLSLNFPSLSKDIVAVVKGDAPVTRVGMIARARGSAFTGFFMEDITLDNRYETLENSFSAPYFPLRYFEVGKTYEILYIPNTRIILDAKLR